MRCEWRCVPPWRRSRSLASEQTSPALNRRVLVAEQTTEQADASAQTRVREAGSPRDGIWVGSSESGSRPSRHRRSTAGCSYRISTARLPAIATTESVTEPVDTVLWLDGRPGSMFSGQPAHSDRDAIRTNVCHRPGHPDYPWSSVHIGVDDYDRHLRVGHPTIGVDSDSERLEDICCLSPVLQCQIRSVSRSEGPALWSRWSAQPGHRSGRRWSPPGWQADSGRLVRATLVRRCR